MHSHSFLFWALASVLASEACGGTSVGPAIHQDQWVVYEGLFGGQREIYAQPIGGDSKARLTCRRGVDRHPSLHPTEHVLYYLSANPDLALPRLSLTLMRHDRADPDPTPAQLPQLADNVWDYSFSPDGTLVAYVTSSATNVVSSLDGSTAAEFPGCRSPDWSRDGRQLVVQCDVGREIVEVRGFEVEHWSQIFSSAEWDYLGDHLSPTEVGHPAFSPTGRQLAFYADDQENSPQIYVVNLQDGQARQVTNAAPAWRPRWLTESHLVLARGWDLVWLDLASARTEVILDEARVSNHVVLQPGEERFLPEPCGPPLTGTGPSERRETRVVSRDPAPCMLSGTSWRDGITFSAEAPGTMEGGSTADINVTFCLSQPVADDFGVRVLLLVPNEVTSWQEFYFDQPDLPINEWPAPGRVTESYRFPVRYDMAVGEYELVLVLFRGDIADDDNPDRQYFQLGLVEVR